ncbi:MAG: hypothetical protein SVV03_06185 [Candidatus Nanohaloarchaea archaeon]|nr:hypothetical protein [Candidatus Nanohaloarchaea archaeon]
MALNNILHIVSYSGRVKKYIEDLEEKVHELPEGYREEKKDFMRHLKGFLQLRFFYAFMSMVFYASIVASITASVGFRINLFRQLYGILGGSTVLIFYFASMYFHNLARLDFENSKTRLISMLTAEHLRD